MILVDNRAGSSRYAIRATASPQLGGGRRMKVHGVERRLSTWDLFDRETGAVVAEYLTRGDAQSTLARVRAGRLDPKNAADRRLIEALEFARIRDGSTVSVPVRRVTLLRARRIAAMTTIHPMNDEQGWFVRVGSNGRLQEGALGGHVLGSRRDLPDVAAARTRLVEDLMSGRVMSDYPNRAVGGRLTPEERADAPSKIERRLEQPEAARGFSLVPANDVEGMPGSIWVHREPDGATIVRKLGENQFVRIDPLGGGGYHATVWIGSSRGEEPKIARQDARRTTLEAAVTWARDLLTRGEREATTRQRMEAGLETGGELQVGDVVRFRDRGARRRYAVATVNRVRGGQEGGGWTDYHLVALSGGEAGSGPSGVRREQVSLDPDQSVRFEGAIAHRLERKFRETSRLAEWRVGELRSR